MWSAMPAQHAACMAYERVPRPTAHARWLPPFRPPAALSSPYTPSTSYLLNLLRMLKQGGKDGPQPRSLVYQMTRRSAGHCRSTAKVSQGVHGHVPGAKERVHHGGGDASTLRR